MKKEIKIPDIAESVETGLVAGILVSVGDKIDKDQALVEIETDKATTDIPSPYAGVVEEIKVSEGDEVKVNEVIMIIETEGKGEEDVDADEDEDGDGDKKEDEQASNDKKSKKEKSKSAKKEEQVGDSEDEPEDSEDDEDEKEQEEEDESSEEKEASDEPREDEEEEDEESKKDKKKDSADLPASPSVRRLAREKDVDLSMVKGTGPGDRITAEDVNKYAEQDDADEQDEKADKKKDAKDKGKKSPDFAKWGLISVEPMSRIRKLTATNVQQAWQTIPHVTQFDEADITNLENFRLNNQDKITKAGGKLTVTALLLKIVGFALQKFPQFNASLDEANDQIIYKHYYHVGIAVDTEQGLLVPVVRDVNKKSLIDISVELNELAEKARDKKISSDEMQGGSFTISNLGGIGGTGFTPIVYAPQVAILGVARSKYQQVLVDDEFQKRLVIPLSLSYDHRVIDGADGARFLRWICQVIEDPYAILQ